MEFQWWYPFVGLFLAFLIFGKRKGGIVVTRVSADLRVLDPRFAGCRPEAKYSTFKDGSPDHIEIELDDLSLSEGEEVEFHLNGTLLARVPVKRNREAEFDHWSDEDVDFPVIRAGDELLVRYLGADVMQGTFR